MAEYQGIVQEDGRIQLEGGETLPKGMQVRVIPDDSSEHKPQAEGIPVDDLLNAPFVGAWKDRDDIGDSAEFAEKIRRRAERRE